MSPFCFLPTKKEEWAVVTRRLTSDELRAVVHEVYDDALIWHEDPRGWFSYAAFLGYQISKAVFRYQIGNHHKDQAEGNQELQDFVAACLNYAIEQGELL